MNKRRFRGRWQAGAITVLVGLCCALAFQVRSALAQTVNNYSLRFYGHGVDDIDRVKIQVDDPTNSDPGPPVDVGATDFTLEFWMKADAAENTAPAVTCGENSDWILGNIVFDRDRFDQDRKFGLSIAGGVFVFGVNGEGGAGRTICGTTNVLDSQWRHIAIQRRRSDGWMSMYVDGSLESQADGPDGNISYPDDAMPAVRTDVYCQGPDGAWNGVCENDPYLVIGAEKHDAGSDDGTGNYPSYSGWIDEIRVSNSIRYAGAFSPPTEPFRSDSNTVALYHLDAGTVGACTGTVLDSSGAQGGPSHGACSYGGAVPAGPVYTTDVPFTGSVNPPSILNVAASPLATSAAITWATDKPATSQVTYGISPTLTMTTTEIADHVIVHEVVLTGLSADTRYAYVVRSRDTYGNATVSEEYTFKTLALENTNYVHLPLVMGSFSSSGARMNSHIYLMLGSISTVTLGAVIALSVRTKGSGRKDPSR